MRRTVKVGACFSTRGPMPNRTYTLEEISKAIDGRLVGDGALKISRLAHPAAVESARDLALAMDPKLLPLLKESKATAAVVTAEANGDDLPAARIIVVRPRVAMAKLTALFATQPSVQTGIHPTAVIESGAVIGVNAAIGAHVYIGEGATIGDNATLHPQSYVGEGASIGHNALIHAGVKIGAGTTIGDNVIIHFNTSIGADGFSFVTPQIGSVEEAKAGGGGTVSASNTSLLRIASLAPVIIGNDVEIGANTSIDRGTIASTRIGNGTKIDNQVQIGHNVSIGDNCMICGRAGIAGSAVIGNRVVLGGAVGVADHVKIGDDAIVMAMSGVAGNVATRTVVGGIPSAPREKMMENLFNIGRIKKFIAKVDSLAKRLDLLETEGKKDR